MSDKEVIGLLEIIDIYIDGRQVRRSSLGACYIDAVAVGMPSTTLSFVLYLFIVAHFTE